MTLLLKGDRIGNAEREYERQDFRRKETNDQTVDLVDRRLESGAFRKQSKP